MSERVKWKPGQEAYVLFGLVDVEGVYGDDSEPAIDASSLAWERVAVVRAEVGDGKSGAWVRTRDGVETWYEDRFLEAAVPDAVAVSVGEFAALRAERDALRGQLAEMVEKSKPSTWNAEIWFMEAFDVDWVDSPTYANEVLRQYVEARTELPVPGDRFAVPTRPDGWQEEITGVEVMLQHGEHGSTIMLSSVLGAGGRILKRREEVDR